MGAGIAGCTIAYQLARRGARVRVFERGVIAGEASGRNMGLLLNQTEPGVVRLMQRSLEFYDQLAGTGVDFDYRRLPQVMVTTSEDDYSSARGRAQELAATGLRTETLDAGAVRAQFPFLSDAVAGGFVVGDAVVLEPTAATHAFAEAARSSGAVILPGIRVARIAFDSGRAVGVITDAGRFATDAVVLANGPWLGMLWPAPLLGGRGWLLRTGPLTLPLDAVIEEMSWPDQNELGRAASPPTLAEVAADYDRSVASAFVICPLPTGDALVGTSLSPSLRDAYEGVGMPQSVAERAVRLAPGLSSLPVVAAWYGIRPMTPDGMPAVGAAGPDGLYIHGGHGSIGMMTAPATADWLAELIVSGTASPELEPLRPDRF